MKPPLAPRAAAQAAAQAAPQTTTAGGAARDPRALTAWPLLLAVSGWAAAAAMLFVLVFSSSRTADPGARRAELLEVEPDTQVLAWSAGGPGGDVTWSDSRNEGYLRISGLPVNDPRESSYQLWIFRGAGAGPYPVDGGVFDVLREGEIIIRIQANIEVGHAARFTVTVEEPGGVVVSDRERVVAEASRA